MKVECGNLERSLGMADDPAVAIAIADHGAICPGCREKINIWNEISSAAPSLRKMWDAPELWPKIHLALAAESQSRREGSRKLWIGAWILRGWRPLAAALALMTITSSIVLILVRNAAVEPPVTLEGERRLLTEKALAEIELAEARYILSIEKLSLLVVPRLENAATPLMMSYREKLVLIDSAISDLRANIELNRFNAHMRRELISIYQEKQRTLQALLTENPK
jgi:hypothetical protein